jgi:hypothetical protein
VGEREAKHCEVDTIALQLDSGRPAGLARSPGPDTTWNEPITQAHLHPPSVFHQTSRTPPSQLLSRKTNAPEPQPSSPYMLLPLPRQASPSATWPCPIATRACLSSGLSVWRSLLRLPTRYRWTGNRQSYFPLTCSHSSCFSRLLPLLSSSPLLSPFIHFTPIHLLTGTSSVRHHTRPQLAILLLRF